MKRRGFFGTVLLGAVSTACSNGNASPDAGGCAACACEGVLDVPNALEFGRVLLGESATLTLDIQDASACPLDILSLDIVGDTTQSYAVDQFGMTPMLVAEASTSLTVTFTPTQAGPAPAHLAFADDGQPNPTSVELVGTGVPLVCGCAPTLVALGGATGAYSQTVTCTNGDAGVCDLTISAAGTSAAFSFTDANGPVASPSVQTLVARGTYALTVAFDPSVDAGAQSYFTDIACTPDGLCLPQQSISLTGAPEGL